MGGLTLRLAEPADREQVTALFRACFAEPWSPAAVAGHMIAAENFCLIAVTDSGACGFALARSVLDEAEILTIGVVPEWRRQGLGLSLVDAVVTEARERGALRLHLEVAVDNHAALGLYRRAGFRQVGRRRGYYPRGSIGRVDALLMRRDLSN